MPSPWQYGIGVLGSSSGVAAEATVCCGSLIRDIIRYDPRRGVHVMPVNTAAPCQHWSVCESTSRLECAGEKTRVVDVNKMCS